ncbi:MAG TPA: PEGA domain-containing protein [Polyangiaceae bacterium]|nr:PEGA domain-containing protein [Polyangiaceae bacterium]
MVSPRPRRALALALCLSIFAPAAAVRAQPRPEGAAPSRQELDEAQKRYKRGLELFNEGQYEASMIEFRRAYELAPSYKLLFNIAQVNRQINDYARAVEFFERYLREGGSNVAPGRVAEVQKELERLRQRVARLEVTSNVAGAEVFVDDLSVGRTPFAQPLLVNAGRRKLVAAAEGRPPVTRVVEVAGAESARVLLDFVEVPDPARAPLPGVAPAPIPVGPRSAPAEAPPGAGPEAPAGARVPWVAWGVTGALAAGAAVTGVLALQAKSHFEEHRDTFNTTRAELEDQNDKARRLGVATDVLLGATAVAAGVSLYLTLTAGPKGAGATSGALRLRVGPGGAGLAATF